MAAALKSKHGHQNSARKTKKRKKKKHAGVGALVKSMDTNILSVNLSNYDSSVVAALLRQWWV